MRPVNQVARATQRRFLAFCQEGDDAGPVLSSRIQAVAAWPSSARASRSHSSPAPVRGGENLQGCPAAVIARPPGPHRASAAGHKFVFISDMRSGLGLCPRRIANERMLNGIRYELNGRKTRKLNGTPNQNT